MTFGESIKTCFRKYAVFKGRAMRSEFWWFVLLLLLIEIGLSFVTGLLMIPLLIKGQFNAESIMSVQLPLSIVMIVVELVFLLPSLGVLTRRLHDRNKSGWWIFVYYLLTALCMVPMFLLFTVADHSEQFNDKITFALVFVMSIMSILLLALGITILVWCCQRGTIGPNKYGPDPLEKAYVDVTPQPEV